MNSNDAPQGESFDERAETLNSNLQGLIEAIGGLLTASGELLGRLQQLLSAPPAAAGVLHPPCDDDTSLPPERHEE